MAGFKGNYIDSYQSRESHVKIALCVAKQNRNNIDIVSQQYVRTTMMNSLASGTMPHRVSATFSVVNEVIKN